MEHVLAKPVESRKAFEQRRKTIVFAMVLAIAIAVSLAVVLVT